MSTGRSKPAETQTLIMVMGVQRSGTSVLFQSLATDKSLRAFPEDIDSAFYSDFRLRPVAELAPLIAGAGGRVILKPISETGARSLTALAEEYRSHPLRFVWIYRNPIDVWHSMQREKWIALEEIKAPGLSDSWRKRNAYALQLQDQSPDQIAIVRYEDLCLDRAVFEKLTRWLGLNCRSYFRSESGYGRAHSATAVQENVDPATVAMLSALDAARTFKPRQIVRAKERIASRFRKPSCPEEPMPEPKAVPDGLEEPAERGPLPSEIEGLHFWLNAAAICESNAQLTSAVVESGPHRMVAPAVENGPYGFLSLNRSGTIYYPHTKVEQRRAGPRGTLLFGAGQDWSFFFDGGAFTLFALFRPNLPSYPPYNQERARLLRVGARESGTPEFSLTWDNVGNASSATIVEPAANGVAQTVVSTPLQSQPRQKWHMVDARYDNASDELSISGDGVVESSAPRPSRGGAARPCEGVLELGGCAQEYLYYGEIAQLIIFKRALDKNERATIRRYLTQTYHL